MIRKISAPLALGLVLALGGCTCEDIPAESTVAKGEELKMQHPRVAPQANGCLPQPAAAAPATQKLPSGGTVTVSAFGRDVTDESGVAWDQPYPSPCLDDRPPRRGYPNAAWQGNYTIEGNTLCLMVEALYPHYPPKHTVAIGYTVELEGLTFDDGSVKKDIVVYEFSRIPADVDVKKCITLKM
jgi:hypothetical protein